jgi:hypothetical protein
MAVQQLNVVFVIVTFWVMLRCLAIDAVEPILRLMFKYLADYPSPSG